MSSFSADSKAAASGEDVAENALMEYVTELLDDAPKLQVALKNLMAVLLGSDASRRTADDELDGKVTDIKAFDLLICSKTLIKCVSELSFAEAPQWGVEHPQREDQNFSDRIAEISQYKAALLFFSRAKTSESGISKIVGRKFIQRTKCMPAIRLNVKEKLASKVEDDIIELFLNTFDDSVKGTGANVDLIWCHDFRAALAERQQARKCEAEIRASYVVSDVEEATLVPSDEPVGDAGTES